MFTMVVLCRQTVDAGSCVAAEDVDRGEHAGRRGVPDADHLRRLALPAVRRPENFQCRFIADPLEAAPEVCRDAAIVGVLDDGGELAAFDELSPFAAELEFVARIVDRP